MRSVNLLPQTEKKKIYHHFNTQKHRSLGLFSIWLVIIILISLLGFSDFSKAGVNEAVSYLKTQPANPWVTMALVAAGETNVPSDHLKNINALEAIESEAPILAITALNQDPRTFGNIDLVAKLKSYYQEGQIGDKNNLNDDIFGILALVASGEPISDPMIQGAKNTILANQNTNGGWGYAISASPDTNMTASAIMALLEVDVNVSNQIITKAVNYLKNAQNSDGGFPYDPLSPFGTASDSASDSWVISAIYKIGENPNNWLKDNKNPLDHLKSLQAGAGYFEYQKGSGQDSFSPTTTAYAVIALSNKFLPVNKITLSEPRVGYRLEGASQTICEGKTNSSNPLDLIKKISTTCNFTYHITESSFGPYLDQINNDKASGMLGWLYRVNWVMPQVGAQDYQLKENDEVLWYYGDFSWPVIKISLDQTEVNSNQSIKVKIEWFDETTQKALSGATVKIDSLNYLTDNSGEVILLLADGLYNIYGEKQGYIRSSKIKATVGSKTQQGIGIKTEIDLSQSNVGGQNITVSNIPMVSFNLDVSQLDFGKLKPGQSQSKNVKLSNSGQNKLYLESIVSGDSLFQDNLEVGEKHWTKFNTNLEKGDNKNIPVKLSIPSNYKGSSGNKTGNLIFWGIKAQ